MTDEQKEAIRDKAMRIYWLMVVAAIFFALGVLYGTSDHTDDAPLAIPVEAGRQGIPVLIVREPASSESPPSASQGVS